MGEVVETFHDGSTWRNRIGGREPLPGEHVTCEAACEVARGEARVRGVEHVVRRQDGSVAERHRYPRRSCELPA